MPREFTESLPCHLRPGELLAKADEAAHTSQRIARLELAFAAEKKERKAEIDGQKERVRELHREIREKTEHRDVLCVEVMDWRENAVKVIRLDDRTVVRERAMTVEERQMELSPKASEIAEEATGIFDD